jgi:hypothetical protein
MRVDHVRESLPLQLDKVYGDIASENRLTTLPGPWNIHECLAQIDSDFKRISFTVNSSAASAA